MAKRNKKGGWYKHPNEHALASRGIKTVYQHRAKAVPKGKREYTIDYGGRDIRVTEKPNAHDPYNPNVYVEYMYVGSDKIDGKLYLTSSFSNYSREYIKHKEKLEDGDIIQTKVIEFYHPDGTEIRFEYDYSYYGDEHIVSKLDEYINVDLIELPLNDLLYTEIFPMMISDKAYEIFDDISPRAEFSTHPYLVSKSPGERDSYSIDFDVTMKGKNTYMLYYELKKSPYIHER